MFLKRRERRKNGQGHTDGALDRGMVREDHRKFIRDRGGAPSVGTPKALRR